MVQSRECGDLRDRVCVLQLTETDTGWAWTECRTTWANVEPVNGQNLFSRMGTGAPGVSMVFRRQEIRPGQMLIWKNLHIYPTASRPYGLGHIQVDGAIVRLSSCRAGGPVPADFPAVLAEKYVRHEQLDPYAVNTITYVLITPPEIVLRPGTLVTVDSTYYQVLLAHVLDLTQREYEIKRTADL